MNIREALNIIYGAIDALYEYDHDFNLTKVDKAMEVLNNYIKEKEEYDQEVFV